MRTDSSLSPLPPVKNPSGRPGSMRRLTEEELFRACGVTAAQMPKVTAGLKTLNKPLSEKALFNACGVESDQLPAKPPSDYFNPQTRRIGTERRWPALAAASLALAIGNGASREREVNNSALHPGRAGLASGDNESGA